MPRIVALVPAYNEEGSINETIRALLAQERTPDHIVVIPNGCTDNTATLARQYEEVTVYELPKLEHKKSEALNRAWMKYAMQADIVVCLDADTVLPPNAIGDWEREFTANSERLRSARRRRGRRVHELPLGGSSSKFTMPGNDFLTRLQRAEFSRWTDTALARGWTSVLAGTGCAISGEALRQVVATTKREGPWSYESQVEDFELTYLIRKLGWHCQVSPTVRAYTDSMKTVRALWGQRMKWQVGTVEDLLTLGVDRLTLLDWWQQLTGLLMAGIRMLWVAVFAAQIITHQLHFQLVWWVVIPVIFVGIELHSALRIPHRDKIDVLMACLIVPAEIFAWLRSGWFMKAWIDVLVSRMTGKRKDRWQLQYAAEASE